MHHVMFGFMFQFISKTFCRFKAERFETIVPSTVSPAASPQDRRIRFTLLRSLNDINAVSFNIDSLITEVYLYFSSRTFVMSPDVPKLSMIEEEFEDSSSTKNAQVG